MPPVLPGTRSIKGWAVLNDKQNWTGRMMNIFGTYVRDSCTGRISAVWARCELWELTPSVCERARQVGLGKSLPTLDALHLATFVLAREKIEGLELETVDGRLQAALEAV